QGRELSGISGFCTRTGRRCTKTLAVFIRGCGFIALENLLFFARTYPCGKRSEWEYPFAVAGINVSYMLIQMLDLQSEKPKNRSGTSFLKLLGEDDTAFDVLFCITFQLMDAQWLAMRASYMEFSEVLQVTRAQLER
ncbi:Engulfment and cell motility protein 3, partial [Linum perenne]